MGRNKIIPPNYRGTSWYYRETIDGERKYFYSNISYEDAEEKCTAYKNKKLLDEYIGEEVKKNTTFKEWATRWLESVKPTVKDNTYNNTYANAVEKHLIPHFKNTLLADIKPIHIQEFFNKKSKKYAFETLHKIKFTLNKLFECAIDNDLCLKNPCKNIKLVSEISPEVKNTYSQQQTDLVLEYAKKHRYGLEVTLLLECGLSRSELLGIRWQDIDFEKKVLYIRQGVTDIKDKETKKMKVEVGGLKNQFREREIPILNDDTIKRLIERPKSILIGQNKHKKIEGVEKQTKFVFYNSKGDVCSPRTWSRRHYDVFMEDMHDYYAEKKNGEMNIPILNPHELRHTRATLWVNGDKNLFAIASVLGWADLKMLRKRYGHSDVESNRKLLK